MPQAWNPSSAALQTGPKWAFVPRDLDEVRAINYKLGERSEILCEHRNQIVLSNDATGEWQRDSAFSQIWSPAAMPVMHRHDGHAHHY